VLVVLASCRSSPASTPTIELGMLQVFYMDVAKVNQDIAYVAIVLNILFVFQTYVTKCAYQDVTYVSRICCKCFI
jgi:hypothetical protein